MPCILRSPAVGVAVLSGSASLAVCVGVGRMLVSRTAPVRRAMEEQSTVVTEADGGVWEDWTWSSGAGVGIMVGDKSASAVASTTSPATVVACVDTTVMRSTLRLLTVSCRARDGRVTQGGQTSEPRGESLPRCRESFPRRRRQ
ncbi:hypothetical protein G6O67_003308 [Ophiocordyceps sinensis]|uniref:Uncharacterized protein n=1 Tax=Ophiocordyceps sinensis TaxID=72228 RepID=A0A8H4V8E6_9HYPO|nr:hypothetical protein G6O67_003308 [Ophiocordyceps sinensis]